MTSKQPLSIDVDEMAETITVVLPLAPMDCQSESGKMNILCTTNGWLKTTILCPRTAKMIQINIFVGTRV